MAPETAADAPPVGQAAGLGDQKPPTEGKPSTGRWDAVGKWIDFLQKVFAFAGVAMGVLAAVFLLTVGQKQTIVVDKFSVAEDVKKIGYDETAFARELADRIRTMTRETTSLKDHRAAYSYDNEPLVQIEESSLTVKSLAELIERFRAKRRYIVTGEVTHQADQDVHLTVRVEDHAAVRFTVPLPDLDQGIEKSAEYVLSSTEPYIYAAYLLTRGRDEEALKAIQFCLANPPLEDDQWAYNLWGVYFLERKQYDEAIDRFRRATELDPTFSIAFLNWAVALEYRGPLAEALSTYRKANALRPSVGALAGEGRIMTRLGKAEEGISALSQAVRTEPRDRSLRIDLANAYISDQRFEKALQELEFARDLGPLDLDVETRYAAVLDRLGLSDRAIEVYRRIVAASPEADLAKERLQALTEDMGKKQ